MKGKSWCEINTLGEITHLDWEYIELRAALHRKRFSDVKGQINAQMSEDMEGIVAMLALAIREQILRSKIPDGEQK